MYLGGQELDAAKGSFPTGLQCCVTMKNCILQVEPSCLSWVSKRLPGGAVCCKSEVPGGLLGHSREKARGVWTRRGGVGSSGGG